ncbi:hypothetical protein IAR55_002919 [Kwoniella newhampshirensis]|uniref:N-acetyltransferase domain-containing protein n=1 Tax=Kwoniella newhampshirensis TaxID=1651941 RepID=A0AAW0Z012_9TREE
MSPAYMNKWVAQEMDLGSLPRVVHLQTPLEEYYFNYCFEVKELRSDRVELRPLCQHAELVFQATRRFPDLKFGYDQVRDIGDILVWLERERLDPEHFWYVIFAPPPGELGANPHDYVLAGFIGFVESKADKLRTELSIMVLPSFQRTHVQTHASGLLIHRALDHPTEGGLGLNRIQWAASSTNLPSQNASRRLGFVYEGLIRCDRMMPPLRAGAREGRKGTLGEGKQIRDDWVSLLTWYDWEGGARDHVDRLMTSR